MFRGCSRTLKTPNSPPLGEGLRAPEPPAGSAPGRASGTLPRAPLSAVRITKKVRTKKCATKNRATKNARRMTAGGEFADEKMLEKIRRTKISSKTRENA